MTYGPKWTQISIWMDSKWSKPILTGPIDKPRLVERRRFWIVLKIGSSLFDPVQTEYLLMFYLLYFLKRHSTSTLNSILYHISSHFYLYIAFKVLLFVQFLHIIIVVVFDHTLTTPVLSKLKQFKSAVVMYSIMLIAMLDLLERDASKWFGFHFRAQPRNKTTLKYPKKLSHDLPGKSLDLPEVILIEEMAAYRPASSIGRVVWGYLHDLG